MVSNLSDRKVIKTEIDAREWAVAVTHLTILFLGECGRLSYFELRNWLNAISMD